MSTLVDVPPPTRPVARPLVTIRLQQVLNARGLTQTQAAAQLGWHRQFVSRLVNANPPLPSMATLYRLCIGLDCTLSELVELHRPEEPKYIVR